MKKLLYITHFSGLRVNRFWLTSISAAQNLNYEFHLASNMRGANPKLFGEDCKTYNIIPHQIDFERNPLSRQNRIAYKQLLKLMQTEQFDIVHCNTPIGGLIGRICAHKSHVPYVIYQAHGFHFWKNAPLKNRMIYFSIEKFMARYTDILITINQEDFLAATQFRLKIGGTVKYVPGVGIEVKKIKGTFVNKTAKRLSLGIPADSLIFLTVAELNTEKNYETIIRAFDLANIPNSYLLICGKGKCKEHLASLIQNLNRQDQIKLLGYRTDIMEIYQIADCFVFASLREGLSVALMEAMASGLPCIASKIRGNVDLLPKSSLLFHPTDIQKLADLMHKIRSSELCRYETQQNLQHIQSFDSSIVTQDLTEIYKSCNS